LSLSGHRIGCGVAGLTQFSSAGGNPEPVYSSPDERRSVTVEVCEGVWLDHRKALVMPTEGWMAVADLHYGFEVHRRAAHGALLPDFGMAEVEERLLQLVRSYDVKKLILVGDIMDGAGSADLTADFLDRIEAAGPELICVAGNHDRAGLKSRRDLIPFYAHRGGIFSSRSSAGGCCGGDAGAERTPEWLAGDPGPPSPLCATRRSRWVYGSIYLLWLSCLRPAMRRGISCCPLFRHGQEVGGY
jgi:hypothetical protein